MSDQVQRLAHATRSSDSYGRTDGLTKTERDVDGPLAAVDARGRTEIPTIGEMIQTLASPERHQVTRSGERQPIPHFVRNAVWFRDRGLCELCGTHDPIVGPWELDHIIPWSAGGSDDTTNLRVLCQRHNQERSNFVDHGAEGRGRRAATWWCANCYTLVEDEKWWWYEGPYTVCPSHSLASDPSGSACRVARNYWWLFQRDALENWHQRPAITEPTTIAYCAHCDAPALTDMPL